MQAQLVTYHHPTQPRLWSEHDYLDEAGLEKGTKLLLPKHIDDKQDSLFIPCLNAASGAPSTMHTISGKLINGRWRPVLDIKNKRIAKWLSGYKGYFIHYTKQGLRVTRLTEPKSGRCAKQVVVATLVTKDGETVVGTNRCLNPQTVCPRDAQGMKSGEGYHLCKEVCQQYNHAEVDAITRAGKKAKGAVIYLQGHHYACDNCKAASIDAGADIIVSET